MKFKQLLIATMLPVSVFAASENGTGSPNINLVIDDNQRIVLSIQDQELLLQGSSTLQQGTAEVILDALIKQALVPDAARAEVSVDCNTATVLIYQQTDGELIVLEQQQLPVAVCQ